MQFPPWTGTRSIPARHWKPLVWWVSPAPPDHPRYQRFIAFQSPHAPHRIVVWVRTGPARGNLNEGRWISPRALDRLYTLARRPDHRRSLRRVLHHIAS